MGLFGDVDASSIPDDPWYVAPGTYLCVVEDAAIRDKKDQTGQGLALNYSIVEEDNDYTGMRIQEWKNLPNGDSDSKDARTDRSRVKQRLLSLGVPEDVMNSDDTDWLKDLIGVEVYVTVFERASQDGTRTYTNVGNVKLVESE